MVNYDECQGMYNNIVYEEFMSLKLVISQGLRKLNVQLSKIKIEFPFLPTNLRVINLNKKGCSKWTKILKEKKNNVVSDSKREKLGIVLRA